ncbi:MAG: Sec-independent protein translocase protein TatB [Pseudomonadota bacterium]
MFDIGWSELLIIGLVALIVVGPKDLPIMFRRIGQWVGRMRNMARDFQRAMDQAADEAGVTELKKGFKEATNVQDKVFGDAAESLKNFQKEVDSTREVTKIDAAAEHARRQKIVEEANKAAETWEHSKKEDAEEVVKAEVDEKPEPKKAAPKAGTRKPPAKKPAAKKAPAKKQAVKKAAE